MCEEPNPNLLFINFICFFFYVNTALILNFKPIEIHHGLKLAQESKDYLPSNFHNQQCLKHVFVLCLSMKLVLWFKIFNVFVCESSLNLHNQSEIIIKSTQAQTLKNKNKIRLIHYLQYPIFF